MSLSGSFAVGGMKVTRFTTYNPYGSVAGVVTKPDQRFTTYNPDRIGVVTKPDQRFYTYPPWNGISSNTIKLFKTYIFYGGKNPIADGTSLYSQYTKASGAGTGVSLYYIRGINIDRASSVNGDSSERHLQTGVKQNNSEGSPTSPSLKLEYPGMWRFRWPVNSGLRSVSIKCKQVCNLSPRPTLTVRANGNLGIISDISMSAPSGTDWVTIGPISFTPTSNGVVRVEIKNNISNISDTPTYFDHVVFT